MPCILKWEVLTGGAVANVLVTCKLLSNRSSKLSYDKAARSSSRCETSILFFDR